MYLYESSLIKQIFTSVYQLMFYQTDNQYLFIVNVELKCICSYSWTMKPNQVPSIQLLEYLF